MTASSGALAIAGVDRVYQDALGRRVPALSGINLDVRPGEFVSLIGPSGCGKTTLLRLVAGLDAPTAGTLRLDENSIAGPHYERGYVFQQSNLFPWETIEGNIASGLKARKIYRERRREIPEYIRMIGLDGFGKSYPHQVSGGMAQRAALARVLINDPKVLLLDEPLGALDAFTRMDLQQKLLELWRARGITILLVTHDVDEAIFLSTRVVIMTPRPGKIEEVFDVNISHPRERNSPEFLSARNYVMEKLHMVSRREDPEFFL